MRGEGGLATSARPGTRPGTRLSTRQPGWLLALLPVVWLLAAGAAWGSGPRFVTGPPFFTGSQGQPIPWRQTSLLYYTDPGQLSANVNHVASDALVAAAVGVWNLPQASIAVAQGGALAEHVSSANTYLDTNGMEFPADVKSSNAAAVPIAIVYDTDGSVTDTLLGSGSSLPSACRTNAVTSTVDSFDPAGYILHAVIVLNGRCMVPTASTTAPLLALDMQYKLMRAFGRVLGLAWSQTNDNVFSGSPVPTNNQALHWPVMHPIDIICGLYSFQCLPSPFVLRPDDVASMVGLYPNAAGSNEAAGKQDSLASANSVYGLVSFPNGQGMTDVNVLVKRQAAFTTTPDAWYEASAVTGIGMRRAGVSPFVAAGTDAASSMGTNQQNSAGVYAIAYLPLLGTASWDDLIAFTEPVNPLYTGAYSLGPHGPGVVAPAGSTPSSQTGFVVSVYAAENFNFPIVDAPEACGTGSDGTVDTPASVPVSGYWSAVLCGYGHASYLSVLVKPGRTLTVEATALDANGLATTTKAMPAIGLFAPTDSDTALPSVGVTGSAFNTLAVGTTSLLASTGTLTWLRVGVADERGEGRPDFPYQGRIFYADEVAPTHVPPAGSTLTITGMGFRTGNAVLVNGVQATVTSWSANKLVAVTPTLLASGATAGSAVDVEVLDGGTGASSTLTGALVYSPTAGNAMILVSAPAGTIATGVAATPTFAVRVVASDGVTPVPGRSVGFSVASGSATFAACGASACTVTTDSTGLAQTAVAPAADGVLSVQAADGALVQTVNVTAQTEAASLQVYGQPSGTQIVGQPASEAFAIRVYGPNDYNGIPNHLVTFTVPTGSGIWSGCNAPTCSLPTNAAGVVYGSVTPTAAGAITVQANVDGLTTQASFVAIAQSDTLTVVSAPSATAYVNESAGTFGLRLLHPDGTPAYGEHITLSAPVGVNFSGCQTNLCVLTTDNNGTVSTGVGPTQVGSFTVQASFGSLVATASFTVGTRSMTLRLVSVPAAGSLVGAEAGTPFSVQLIGLDGVTPVQGAGIAMSGSQGTMQFDWCYSGTCFWYTDANGILSMYVTPLAAGNITLSAVYLGLVQTASFTAVASSDSMQVVTQPGSVYVGVAQTLAVRLIGVNGSTPDSGKTVVFTVAGGSLAGTGCSGGSTCSITTDANGLASVQVAGTAAGAVSVQAAYGTVSQAVSFVAVARPDVLRVTSTPSSGGLSGVVNPKPFTVQVFAPDGVTPAAGRAVVFSVTAGAASFGACTAAFCTVSTDSNGLASTTVTANAGGTVGLLASDGTVTGAASFTAVAHQDVLRVVSQPANGGVVGTANAAAFALRVFLTDGTTPVAGRSITLSVGSGSAGFAACAGASACTLTSDSSGNVASAVTPLSAGSITLQAADGAITASVSFTANAQADILRVTSVPASGGYVGAPSSSGFIVQAFLPDGVTPAAGRAVVLSVSAGSASLGACGAAQGCTVTSDSSGNVPTTVTPLATGLITLQATDGTASVSASFTAITRPDVLRVVSAPSSGGLVGTVNGTAFAVQVLLPDGVTPAAGKAVTLSVSVGSAAFAACAGASTCALTTDSSGQIASAVTPLAAGNITLQLTDGTVAATASFSAVARPDVLRVVSAPSSGGTVGAANATAFQIQVLQGDGVTPAASRRVVLSVASGSATFGACAGASGCTSTSDASGLVTSVVTPQSAGSITLQAADGAVVVTASFAAVAKPDVLSMVSAPSSGGTVGTANTTAFAVRALLGDGVTPAVGKSLVLSVTSGSASFGACAGASTCTLTSDASGLVTSAVTPLSVGSITLGAADGAVMASTTFTVLAKPDTMQVVLLPANGSLVGDVASSGFSVKVLEGDGVTPAAGRAVVLSVTSGSATLQACGASSCSVTSDSNGLVSTGVEPLAAGSVTLTSAEGAVTANGTFTAVDKPNLLLLISAPANGAWVGVVDTPAFAVRLVKADGVTPVAGASVLFRVSAGSASLGACGGASCTVATDGTGLASSGVTALAAGSVTVQAGIGTLVESASFTASVRPDVVTVESAPADGALVGDTAATPFSVQVLLGDGVTPAAGKSVTLAVTGGSARLVACGAASCVLTASAQGIVSSAVVPLAAGEISLGATDGSVAASAAFRADAKPDVLRVAVAPAARVFVGDSTSMAVQVLLADGVTPVAGRSVTYSLTAGAAQIGSCAGVPACAGVTDSSGLVTLTLTPAAAGTISVSAAETTGAGNSVAASVAAIVRPDSMTLVSAPSGTAFVGDTVATPFAVRVLGGDGMTPAAGRTVVFTVMGGQATLNACGASTCAVATDASGLARTAVTATDVGVVSLSVTEASNVLTASFNAVARADVLTLVSAPGSAVLQGATSAQAFSVRLTQSDGVTPVAGSAVVFSIGGRGAGQVQFAACAASSCTVLTGADGSASTAVTGTVAGALTLLGTPDPATAAGSVSVPFQVGSSSYNLAALEPVSYLAEGVTFGMQLGALASENGSAAAGQVVGWTAGSGIVLAGASTTTDAGGATAMQAQLGPLLAGQTAEAQACGWPGVVPAVCATFDAVGVPASQFALVLVSGGGQAVTGGGALASLVVGATDAAGHAVAGVPVNVYQTVTAVTAPCPATGRCPAQPVLASRVTVVPSDANGLVTVVPLTVDGVAAQTNVDFSAGTQGAATAVLTRSP